MMEGWILMYKLNFKIKIITFLLTISFIITVYSVNSVTRTITNTHDDIDTFIRNSNGNYWLATGDNIQVAIDDLEISAPSNHGYGGRHGYVWLPGNSTITISATIDIDQFVTLDMQGCEIQPSSNFNIFRLYRGSQIRNGCIDVSDVANFDSAAILFHAPDQIGIWDTPPVVTNMRLSSNAGRGKAIYLNNSGSTSHSYISCVWAYNIKIEGFQYGIYLNRSGTSSNNVYINGNVFTDIVITNCTYPIRFYSSLGSGTHCTGNMLENIMVYCNQSTEYVMYNDATATQADKIYVIDWDNNSGTRTSFNFIESNWCYLCFSGGGDDLSFPTWSRFGESHCILDLEKSTLKIGKVMEYNP